MSKIFIANWKMKLSLKDSLKLVKDFKKYFAGFKGQAIICPDFLSLTYIIKELKNSRLEVGAQDCALSDFGAYTGEVSPLNLKKIGVKYVIIGHSERRQYFSERNDLINKKLKAALAAGLKPILCVGENLNEKKTGKTKAIITKQLIEGLKGIKSPFIIAYEPVWAIGTGKIAKPEEAVAIHKFIKQVAGQIIKKDLKVIYGGSVTAKDIKGFNKFKDINGFLVGGASLKAAEFYKICQQ